MKRITFSSYCCVFCLFSVLFLIASCHPRTISSSTVTPSIVQKSITYHYGKTSWYGFKGTLHFAHVNGNDTSYSSVFLDLPRQEFLYEQTIQQKKLIQKIEKSQATVQYGEQFYPAQQYDSLAKALKIWKVNPEFWFSFFSYLNGVPYKIKDENAHPDSTWETKEYFGEKVNEIKVSFDSALHQHPWYFGFNSESCALTTYRFYFNKEETEGEIVLLSGLTKGTKIQLPKYRKWHYIKDGQTTYTNTDILLKIEH